MNTVDVLKYGHQTVLQTLEGLPQKAWETPSVCDVWSVKDELTLNCDTSSLSYCHTIRRH